MQKVSYNSVSCWADSMRVSPNGKSLIFLSLFGNMTAVRALWARLLGSGHGKRRNYVEIGGESVSLMEGVQYKTLRRPLANQVLHLTIVHPGATNHLSPFESSFALIGGKEGYWHRLNRMCPVPFRESWREQIWGLGRAAGLIKDLPGFGVPGYLVETNEKWDTLVSESIKNGTLK